MKIDLEIIFWSHNITLEYDQYKIVVVRFPNIFLNHGLGELLANISTRECHILNSLINGYHLLTIAIFFIFIYF